MAAHSHQPMMVILGCHALHFIFKYYSLICKFNLIKVQIKVCLVLSNFTTKFLVSRRHFNGLYEYRPWKYVLHLFCTITTNFPGELYRKLVLKPWQNEETCCQKHLLRAHIYRMFPSLPNGICFCCEAETYFAAEISESRVEKMGDVSAANVSGNMFPARFARA